jgi:hypothetical protein
MARCLVVVAVIAVVQTYEYDSVSTRGDVQLQFEVSSMMHRWMHACETASHREMAVDSFQRLEWRIRVLSVMATSRFPSFVLDALHVRAGRS